MTKQKSTKEMMSIPNERIIGKIFLIRGKKVMFDRDLAELYAVEVRTLNQAVKRNINRFPEDFMFQLTKQESDIFLKSQIVTSSENISNSSRSQSVILKKGQNIKYLPYVFTEQGVAMLSAVLKSQRAVNVSIQIVRTFVNLREMLATHKELRDKIEKMEKKNNQNFKVIFEVISRLISTDKPDKTKRIGF